MLDIVGGVHKTKVVGTKIGLKLLRCYEIWLLLLRDVLTVLLLALGFPCPQMHHMRPQLCSTCISYQPKKKLITTSDSVSAPDWQSGRGMRRIELRRGWECLRMCCRPSESGTVPINHLSSHLIATSAWDGRLKICASISVRYFGFWDKKRTFDHIWPIIHFVKQIEESSGVSQLADHFMLIRHFVITFADHTLGWLCIFPNREKSVVESTKGNLLITFMLRKTRCGQDKHNCCNY